jgi:NADH:ubiquinone oxidoreductase subunit C
MKARDEIMARIRSGLGGRLQRIVEKSERRVFVDAAAPDVPEVSRFLFRDLEARLQIASGVDTPTAIEVLYHWALDRAALVVTVRTRLDRERPEVDSIAPLCKGAEWIEREMWELLGIRFRNHPDLRHLLLADEWPEGRYPLRRDYPKDKP